MIKKLKKPQLLSFIDKIFEDNLFLLASSVSYYSALAIAPFLLIILWAASIVDTDIQKKIIGFVSDFSLEVGDVVESILMNVNEVIGVSSFSGIIGLVLILWSSSLVFLQLRYSFDVLYGERPELRPFSLKLFLKDRVVAVFAVTLTALSLMVSTFLPQVLEFFLGGSERYPLYKIFAQLFNVGVYVIIFWSIHYFVPTKRPSSFQALKASLLSSLFFFIGNYLLGVYLKGVAAHSVYGAAGSLPIFLLWTYYSAFTLFLSVEFFVFFRGINKKA